MNRSSTCASCGKSCNQEYTRCISCNFGRYSCSLAKTQGCKYRTHVKGHKCRVCQLDNDAVAKELLDGLHDIGALHRDDVVNDEDILDAFNALVRQIFMSS